MKAGVSVKDFYLDKGAARERERTIKLLENHWAKNSFQNAHEVNGFYLAIALIKGEN